MNFRWLWAVIALGVALRFYGLEHHVLWHDEVYTQFFASGYRAEEWKSVLFTGEALDVDQVLTFQRPSPEKGAMDTVLGLAHDEPQHPPLYYLLARWWVGAFGEGIGTLRALSAVLSLLALPGMYALCRESGGSVRTGWTGTALLAVSPFFILYAQEAREYALWTALSLWSSACLLRALRITRERRSPPWALWAGFSVLTALSLYTALSSSAVILAQIAFVIINEKARFTRAGVTAAGAMAASAVLFSPWLAQIWANFEAFQISMAWSKAISVPAGELIGTFLLNISRVFVDFGGDYAPGVALLWAIGIGAAIAGGSLKDLPSLQGKWLIGALIAAPLLMLLLPDLLFGGIRSLSARYLTSAFLGLLVVVAHAVAHRQSTLAAIFALGLGSSIANSQRSDIWTKSISNDLPEVAAIINASEHPVVVGNMERHHPGNLLALCHLMNPGTKLQFLDHGVSYPVPTSFTEVFLFSPIQPFLDDLEANNAAETELLIERRHLSLWRVQKENSKPVDH